MIPQAEASVNKERHCRIKAALVAQDKKFVDIARKLGVHRSFLCNVSRGQYFTYRAALALAKEAGIPFEELWPERARKPSKQAA